MFRNKAPRLIAESVYWLGSADNSDTLQTNIYMIFRKDIGLIIDPGPRADFHDTLAAAREVAPLEKITALILSEKEPDNCSSLPSWENAGFQGKIITHFKIIPLLKTYGINSPYYAVRDVEVGVLGSREELIFIPLSLKGAPGILLTYDTVTGTFFSSHLFGGFHERGLLFADDSYFFRIARHDFFSSETEVGQIIRVLERLKIERICPQHGCIINDKTERYLKTLTGIRGETERERRSKISLNLKDGLHLLRDERRLDPVTGLYNAASFQSILPSFLRQNPDGAVVLFRLDGMKSFNHVYGFLEGDRAIATFASVLQANMPEDSRLFRDTGPVIIFMLPQPYRRNPDEIMEEMQNRVGESQDFIQDMTCSMAVVRVSEIDRNDPDPPELVLRYMRERLQLLDSRINHSICSSSEAEETRSEERIILIIDPDPISHRLLKDYLIQKEYVVYVCRNGEDALRQTILYRPHIILSETMVPQMDGFRIREEMLQSQELRYIPFIYLSYLKTEDSVRRAQKLGVYHYLRKPVMLTELWGIIRNLAREET